MAMVIVTGWKYGTCVSEITVMMKAVIKFYK